MYGLTVSNSNHTTNYVGTKDEANTKVTMGNCVRQKTCVVSAKNALLIIERSGLMIAAIISIYLIIGTMMTIWMLITAFSNGNEAHEYYTEWYEKCGDRFIWLCVALFTAASLGWPITAIALALIRSKH